MNGIYCFIDSTNNKIVYVGKDSWIHRKKRYYDHRQPKRYNDQPINRVLQNNPDRYEYKVLKKGHFKENLLNALEILYIRRYKPLFNFTIGGDGSLGYKHTKEAKEKLRKLHTGLKASPETRKKLSEVHSGENHHYYGAYGPKHGKYGKNISDESKIRISKPQNTSGYFRVSIRKDDKRYKDRILYRYLYYVDGKQKEITSVDINVLEEKVKAKGLKWLKYDDEEDIL